MDRSTQRILVGIGLIYLSVALVYVLKRVPSIRPLSAPSVRITGDPSAKLTVYEFSDFQCPACAHVQPAVRQLIDSYHGKVRLAFKYYPLNMHQNGMPAARAAECAANQYAFWPYGDKLFATQGQWESLSDPTTAFMAIAADQHLDTARFAACYSDCGREEAIEADMREGDARRAKGTPSFYVGDHCIFGGIFLKEGPPLIDEDLKSISCGERRSC